MRQDITLDVRKRETSFGRAKLLPLRRGEKGNRELVVSIAENGVSYDLTGKAVRFLATTSAGKLVGPIGIEVADAARLVDAYKSDARWRNYWKQIVPRP